MSGVSTLRFHTLHIPFRQRFSHASATRDTTSSVWVKAVGDDGRNGFGEACPRPYVTGETLESARDFFAAVRGEVLAEIRDAATLRAWVAENAALIDLHPAAWCAIELALIDLFARQAGQTAESWLGLPDTAGTFRYSAVLGDADPDAFAATFARYREFGLTDFKLKLSGDLARDRDKLALLESTGAAVARLRLDALDRQGRPYAVEASGFFARVIQHECDHLDGGVYLDRMPDMRTLSFQQEFETYAQPDENGES
jgi:L-alanine-DL-glutamate epimerase-like enolase superfamily enzyme